MEQNEHVLGFTRQWELIGVCEYGTQISGKFEQSRPLVPLRYLSIQPPLRIQISQAVPVVACSPKSSLPRFWAARIARRLMGI